ncbi:MAG: tetratricopeptide repeat protein [Balneolaceae bacterium]
MIRTLTFATVFFLLSGLSTVLSGQDLQESPEKTFQTALQLFQEGLYAEAIPRFRQAADHPDNRILAESAGFHLVLAVSEMDPSLIEEKTEWFLSRHPHTRHSGELLVKLGEKYREQGDHRSALTQFERAVDLPMTDSKRVELIYRMAETAAADDSFDEARDYFLKAADLYPDSRWAPRALYARGRLYLEEEEYSLASEAFELLRTRFPEDAMTRRIGTALGESYYLQQRYEEAIEAFDEALSHLTGENRSKAVYLIAESHNMLDNLDEASQYYRYYLNRAEGEDRARIAHYGLGWVFHKQGLYHWAAESFARATDGDDETARKALYYKGANEKLAGRYRSSLETFREFGDRYQDGLFIEEAYYEWALTAFQAGRYAESIEILLPLARRAETLQEPGKVITFLGESYYANAEYSRAIEAFDVADELTDLDPELKLQARFQRAWVQYSNQAYQQAQGEFEEVYNSAPANSELGGEALFWSADSHYETRTYGPAARHYARFIEENPAHELAGAAKYGLGWSYFMMGDFEQAIEPFRDFQENYEPPSIALYPYDTDVHLRIADSYFALGDYGSALDYYNRVIGAEPGGDYAMFQVANSYYRMDQNFDAVTEFRRMLRIYPYSSLREQAQYNIAYIYLNTGNYEQSVSEFRTVIEQYPQTEWAARSQYNIGDAYYNAGDYEEAINAYGEVLERYPQSDYVLEAIDGIQFAQLSGGDEDTSTGMLEEFLDDNPVSETADRLRYRQAENRYRSGDYSAAVDEFRQYIRITNRTDLLPEAWYNLAESYLRTDRREEAVESYATIVEEYPESERAAMALGQLGELAAGDGDHRSALDYYRQLSDMGSRYRTQAYIGMGSSSLALGNTEDARRYFETVLEESPDNPAANLGIANIRLSEERFEEARDLYRLVSGESSTETGAEAQFKLGLSYQEEGDYEEALREYARVSVLYEAYDIWVAEAKYRSAEIHILQGNRGDAVNVLNDVTDNYPDTEAAEKARRLLDRN